MSIESDSRLVVIIIERHLNIIQGWPRGMSRNPMSLRFDEKFPWVLKKYPKNDEKPEPIKIWPFCSLFSIIQAFKQHLNPIYSQNGLIKTKWPTYDHFLSFRLSFYPQGYKKFCSKKSPWSPLSLRSLAIPDLIICLILHTIERQIDIYFDDYISRIL